MSEFHVTDVFPVSFKPNPSITGDAIGEFKVGTPVELRRADEVLVHGVMEAIELRCPGAKVSLTFSDEISQHIRVGDVIHSMDTTDYLIATHGGEALLASARDADDGRLEEHELIDPYSQATPSLSRSKPER